MKKTLALVLPLSIVVILIFTFFPDSQRTNFSQRDYVQFLIEAAAEFPDVGAEPGHEKVAPDRPDMAAFMEFVKTVDPSTRDVPVQHRFAALEKTRELSRLKGFHSNLAWESCVADMGGRTRTLMFDPNDDSGLGMFAGSVTGGLWYCPDVREGRDWSPINDFWPNLSVSCLSYDPLDPETFYLGTGESETALIVYRESSGRGNGLYESKDGGKTWLQIPSTSDWAYVTDLEIRIEDGISVIYAGVVSGIYKGIRHQSAPTDGLYRSADGGNSWTQVLPDIPGKDYPFAPADICCSADRQRLFVGTTYGINSTATGNDRSGAACILYSDDGISWHINNYYHDRILGTSNMPFPGRVMVTEAPSDPETVFAIVAGGYPSGGFYGYGCAYLLKSTNKGETWAELPFPGGFATLAWHAFTIAVSPDNPDIIWLGGLDTYRTMDGGFTWQKMSDWMGMYGNGSSDYVHGDIHQILFKPNNPRELYIATDGGIFFTGSSTSPDNVVFHERNQNFNTLQYYTCALSPIEGKEHYIGGLQDNGTMNYRPGITPRFTDMLSGGDGAYCFFDPDDPELYLTCSQYSTLYLYRDQGASEPSLVGLNQAGLGIFINPMDFDWRNNRVYLNVSYFDGSEANFIAIGQFENDVLEGDLFSIGTQTRMPFTAVKWDENAGPEVNTLFLGTASGELYRLDQADIPGDVTNLTSGWFPTAYLSNIDIGQTSDTLLVTFSNYGIPSIFITMNGGESWNNLEGNLPDMPVRWAIFHPHSSKHIMLATETGIWTTDNALSENVVWNPNSSGLANVRVDMLRIRPSDHTVLAATHGRGLYTTKWELSTINTVEEVISEKDLIVYPNPSTGLFNARINLPDEGLAKVFCLNGEMVLEQKTKPGEQSFKIDLTGQARGTYLLIIDCGQKRLSKKLVVK